MIATVRWRAGLWSAVALAAFVLCAYFFANGAPLQTNLLALLPPTERNPLSERAIATLNEAMGNRVLLLVSHPDGDRARAASASLAASLEQSGAFRRLTAKLPPLDPAVLLTLYSPHRFGLLTAEDRKSLTSGRFNPAETLMRRLVSPVSDGLMAPLVDDPFGLFARWLSTRPIGAGPLVLDDGFLVARDDGRTHVLVMAELNGSAFDSSQQERVVTAVESAEGSLQRAFPQALVARTGAVFYAAAARREAKHDMDRIALGSTLGIMVMLYLVFRSIRPLLLGLLSVGIGIAAATSAVLIAHGELHLITLVFGASLIGEAIDYSIQYFAAHLHAGSRWNPEAGITSVRPAITVAVATSLLSYGLLAFLPFPAISQISLFALVGLAASYLSVLWLLPVLLTRPSRCDPEIATRWAARLLERWCAALRHRYFLWLCGLVVLASVPGWLRLSADDDVRQLVSRPQALIAQETAIRRLTGFDAGSRFFLVQGVDENEVLERESALVRRLLELERDGALSGHQAVSDLVPPLAMQVADRDLLARTVFAEPQALVRLLTEAGFRPLAAVRLNDAFRANTPLTMDLWARSPLSGPYRHLWIPAGVGGPASIVTLNGERQAHRVAAIAADLPGVILVDKAGSVSELLAAYRRWGGPVLLALGAVVFLVLACRYRAAVAARVMLPVILAEGLSIGVFGYAGEPVTLFAVIGWCLTLGIGVNYAIFLREGRERAAATTAGVLLSAATTLLAFGLLALSGMPALRQFGFALLTGIAAAVLFAPLALGGEERA